LKQNPFERQNEQFAGGDGHPGSPDSGDADLDEMDIARAAPGAIIYSGSASPGGINMLA
jgi:hypothetical protein